MRNSEVTTSIDIDVLHRIAQDWYRKIKMHDLDGAPGICHDELRQEGEKEDGHFRVQRGHQHTRARHVLRS